MKILIIEKGRELRETRFARPGQTLPVLTVLLFHHLVGAGPGLFSDGKLTLSTGWAAAWSSTSAKHLAELIDYIDRIYTDFGATERVYGLENEEEIEDMKRRAVLAEQAGTSPDQAHGHRQVQRCPAANVII